MQCQYCSNNSDKFLAAFKSCISNLQQHHENKSSSNLVVHPQSIRTPTTVHKALKHPTKPRKPPQKNTHTWKLTLSPTSRHFWVDDFPFPQVGYVRSMERMLFTARCKLLPSWRRLLTKTLLERCRKWDPLSRDPKFRDHLLSSNH